MTKLRVLMVAGLTPVAKGGVGGGVVEASTLYNSGLGQAVQLIPLSSTMQSIPPPSLPVRSWAAARRLASFGRLLGQADAVLIYMSSGFNLVEKGMMSVMARRAGCGVVLRFTNGDLPDQCERHPLLKRWMSTVLGSAHAVVAQGSYWKEYFGRYDGARGKILEVPNGIVLPKTLPPDTRGVAPRIGFLGQIRREKGIYELVDAFAMVHRRHPAARLVVGGGGGELEALRARVAELGLADHVELLGWVARERIFEVLRSLTLFTLPSHFEGLPNAVLEAMAAELPCVVTRVGAVPDVIEDGYNGYLVDVGNAQQLGDRLLALLDDPATGRTMGQRSRAIVQARCNIDNVWPRYADALTAASAEAGRAAS
jgi:glycosyltransferase involved in cell wall biosynthesis